MLFVRRFVQAALAAVVLAGCVSSPDREISPAAVRAIGATPSYRGSLEYIGSTWPAHPFPDATFLFYWNQVTPEESSLWREAEPSMDRYEWDDLDAAVRIGQVAGVRVRLHGLVSRESEPDWIGAASDEEQEAQLDEWFANLAERYPGVDFVDVVSDPIDGLPAIAAAIGGEGETGFDWVVRLYEKAREVFPSSSLALYQDGVLNDGRLGSYLALIADLQERGLVDSISISARHMEAGDLSFVSRNLDRLAATGLPIYVSQFTVDIIDDQEHLSRFAEVFELLANHTGVRGITFWGYREGRLESTNAYLLRSDGSHRPALDWLMEYIDLPLPS